MKKIVSNVLYNIFELYIDKSKVVLYIKLLIPSFNENYTNYRTDLLKLYNDNYKTPKRNIYILLDIDSLKKDLFKTVKKELKYFKGNKEILEFIINKIYIIKDKSILRHIANILKPFTIKSNIDTQIKKNLESCLKDILD
jgi:hypothetical protein